MRVEAGAHVLRGIGCILFGYAASIALWRLTDRLMKGH